MKKKNFKEILRIFVELFGKVLKKYERKFEEIIIKFCKLGICAKFVEKLYKCSVQFMNRSNFEEFEKKFEGNFM